MSAAIRRGGVLVLVAALVAPGCATVATGVSVERRESSRRAAVQRAEGPARLVVHRDGFVAELRAERATLCTSGFDVTGNEITTTTRTVADNSETIRFRNGGFVAIALGALLALTPLGSPEARAEPLLYLAAGGALAAGGLLALIPWFDELASTGSSSEMQPYRAFEAANGPTAVSECGVQGQRTVLAFQRDERVLFERTTDHEGRLTVNLAESLPEEAFRGAAPWRAITAATATGALMYPIDLAAYRQSIADTQWDRAVQAATPDSLERFVADFPADHRSPEARERAPALRRSLAALERDQARAAQWADASGDAARLTALIDENVGDVFEAEARCWLAAHAADLADGQVRVSACLHGLAATAAVVRTRRAEVFSEAARESVAAQANLARLESAAREAAERAEAASEAEHRAAEERRDRELRRAAAATRSALARARSIVAECRGGRAAGPSPARAAYEALADVHGDDPAVRSLTIQVAAACRCTPACAGVSSPSR